MVGVGVGGGAVRPPLSGVAGGGVGGVGGGAARSALALPDAWLSGVGRSSWLMVGVGVAGVPFAPPCSGLPVEAIVPLGVVAAVPGSPDLVVPSAVWGDLSHAASAVAAARATATV